MMGRVLSWLLFAALAALSSTGVQAARGEDAGATETACSPVGACPLEAREPTASSPAVVGLSPLPRGSLTLFWAVGCSHCEDAKAFLAQLTRERPGLIVESVEVRDDAAGRRRFIDTMSSQGAAASGVPTFVVGESHLIGFTRGVTEPEIRRLLDRASEPPSRPAPPEDAVQTKWFGRLSANQLGLPLFTLALGLLDGFNPCAMWVLIFLLAMLAGQRDRARMALTAGTFVVVSGVVYFAFMAAWLSVFLVVGMTRPVQLVLGSVALAIGGVNVKDFFAFKRGPSLSIPESAKPGIYARVRRVLQEHTLAGSLTGVAVLAVLVNFVELLCTAGLPAIYTAVLARHELSSWARFAYLGLYNLAYIADDALMVTIAVLALSRRRMTETAGRWLKLVSGAVMLALGSLLVFRPEWLP